MENVLNWCNKHKIGVLPEAWRTAKPNNKDLIDMAKPTLVGLPALMILYLIWEIPGFAAGMAIIVG
ncbi:MAG: hypothetical protein BWK73_50775, partial [Thiothrix lacustris]